MQGNQLRGLWIGLGKSGKLSGESEKLQIKRKKIYEMFMGNIERMWRWAGYKEPGKECQAVIGSWLAKRDLYGRNMHIEEETERRKANENSWIQLWACELSLPNFFPSNVLCVSKIWNLFQIPSNLFSLTIPSAAHLCPPCLLSQKQACSLWFEITIL